MSNRPGASLMEDDTHSSRDTFMRFQVFCLGISTELAAVDMVTIGVAKTQVEDTTPSSSTGWSSPS